MPAQETLPVDGFDRVFRVDCGETVAFVALHTLLGGRAFGGIRIRAYDSEDLALADATQLARAMSRKLALADIRGGGAKAVMIEPAQGVNRADCVRRLGQFIESLEGAYCCGPDLGFNSEDDHALREATRFVAVPGMSEATSTGVLHALKAAAGEVKRVVIQGVGSVGRPLAEKLVAQGVEVVVADPRPIKGYPTVSLDEVYEIPCDVFAPCAMGGVLNRNTISRLHCRVVCGGANNPFNMPVDERSLMARGIDAVPAVLANSGAAIVGASTTLGEEHLIEERLRAIGPMVQAVLSVARKQGRTPQEVAHEEADRRLARAMALELS
ncbi:MAG: leucine dehydrogenase [Planctomycetota bacterium]|nr:MAG: leucine dehydrogenase [Planctomycetota bacterium]